MKETILIELVRKWEKEALEPAAIDGSPEAQIMNAENRGIRKGIVKCANDLKGLISILGNNE